MTPPLDRKIDLGAGRVLEPIHRKGVHVGWFMDHPAGPNGVPEGFDNCCSSFYIRQPEGIPPRPVWTVESEEPLTLSPSLLCSCGDHGFIRNGAWVSA